MSDYQSVLMGFIALAIVGTAAWLGSLLIKRDRTGWGVGLFLIAALIAGVITDNFA